MTSSTGTLFNVDGTAYSITDSGEALFVVQPHQGDAQVWVDFPELVKNRLYNWPVIQNADDEELWEALDRGDLVEVLKYDKQWATVTPVSDLTAAQVGTYARVLERAGVLYKEPYAACITVKHNDDFLTPVDLRELPDWQLKDLRAEAAEAGDGEMVDTIDDILGLAY